MMQRSHTLLLGWALPSFALRGIMLAIMIGATLALVSPAVWMWLAIGAAVVAAVAPRFCTAWVVIVCLIIGIMMDGTTPGRTALALIAVTAIHQLAALTLIVPWRAAVQIAALVPTLQRFFIMQLIAQPLALLLLVGWEGPSANGTPWAAPLGAMLFLLGVTGFVVLSRRGGPRRQR